MAVLTANAVRPFRSPRTGFPTFVAGWIFGELAPQMLAFTVADSAVHLRRGNTTPSKLGLGLAAVSSAGLVHLIRQSMQVRGRVEKALVEGLGVDYVEQLDAAPTPAELATPWRKLLSPFSSKDQAVQVEKNIAYAEFGRRTMLDIYRPVDVEDLADAPVLLQIHGGAWVSGRKNQAVPLMQHMAQRGWVCVAINYRLAPRDAFPAQVIDVKQAIAWIKNNIAAYGGNPDYIVVTGGSAGGHLATLAAVTPNVPEWQPGFEQADTSVQAAVPHYGIYDFAGATGLSGAVRMRDDFLAPKVLQKLMRNDPEAFEAASPLLRIDGDEPDFFVIHGTGDTMVEVDQARAFVEKLRSVSSRSVVYAELPGAQHGFDAFPSIRSAHVVRAIERYLGWHWNTWRAGLPVDHEVEHVTTGGPASSH